MCRNASIYSAPESRDKTFTGLKVSRANVSYQSLIAFDLDGVPTERPVKDAALMLFLNSQFHDSPLRVLAKTINTEWSETEVTQNRSTKDRMWEKGDRGEEEIAGFDISGDYGKGWIVLRSPELTQLVDHWIRGERDNHGLILSSANKLATGPSMKFFESSESEFADRHPKLVIDFDGPIVPAEHGYISKDDLLRIPLSEQLDELASGAKSMGVDVADRLRSLREDVNTVNAGERETIARIEKRIGDLRAQILASKWSGKQVAVWKVSPWEKLSPLEFPRSTSLQLHRRMLQGEYQEICLALTNLSDRPQTLTVRLDLPVGIPADSVEARASYWLTHRLKDVLRGGKSVRYDDDPLPRLARDGSLTLPASQTHRLWLTVDSSRIESATHSIGINISTDTGNVFEVPLQLEVLPIRLEPAPELHVFSYAYLTRRSTMGHEAFAVSDLKAHYENTFVVDAFAMPEVSEDGTILKPANFTPQHRYFLQFISDAKKVLFWWCGDCGSPSNVTFGQTLPWQSAAWRKAMQTWITNWYAYLQIQGFDHDRVVMYPFDESYDNGILGRTEYQALGEIARELHRVDSRINVFANPVAFGPADLEAQRKLADDIDIFAVSSSLLVPGDHPGWPHAFSETDKRQMREFYTHQQQRGKEVWSYLITGQGSPVTDYRQHAWRAWSLGITGLGLWSYNDIRGGTSWDETDDDFTMIYELNDAPKDIPRDSGEPFMPSRRWQARRAGVQDYLLLQQVRRTRPELATRLEQITESALDAPDDWQSYEDGRNGLVDILAKGKP